MKRKLKKGYYCYVHIQCGRKVISPIRVGKYAQQVLDNANSRDVDGGELISVDWYDRKDNWVHVSEAYRIEGENDE